MTPDVPLPYRHLPFGFTPLTPETIPITPYTVNCGSTGWTVDGPGATCGPAPTREAALMLAAVLAGAYHAGRRDERDEVGPTREATP